MSAENFVGSLSTGDNLGAETAFKDEMTSRVADALEGKRKEVAGTFVKNHIPEVEGNEEINQINIPEKDEHKKSKEYKKLSPKMKEAVNDIFAKMDAKPSDFLNTFEKTIKEISKKHKVPEKQLVGYFEKEMLAL